MVIQVLPNRPSTNLDPKATYIVAGLGGLGRALSLWLANKGARHLTLLSRSEASTIAAKDLFKLFGSRSVEVDWLACDVSVPDDVIGAIGCISKARPIKGIIHTAMILEVSQISII